MHAAHARLGLGALLLAAVAVAVAAVAMLGAFDSARADTSGDNPSGYVWIDSNAPDPTVAFEWVDATGGTAASGITDEDDAWETVTLPFTFNFFGADNTEMDISSNGFLSFDIENGCNDNYNWDDTLVSESGNPIPHTDMDCEDVSGWGGNPLIASWFDDLDPGECGDVYYQTFGSAPDRTFVVQFDDVCHNDCFDCVPGEGVTFETILYETTNDIKVQYMDTFFGTGDADISEENNGGTATSGINSDDTVGLGYHWGGDGDSLSDNLAVLYTAGQPEPTPTPTPTPEPTAAPTATATPTATAAPAELPDTGTPPANGADFPWLLAVVTGLVAITLGGFWLARRAAAR